MTQAPPAKQASPHSADDERFMRAALEEALGLKFEGRAHSGIDDARNIARVALTLLHRGAVVGPTSEVCSWLLVAFSN